MPIQDGVNRTDGRDLDRVRQSPQQALANLPSSPGWPLAPGCNDRRLQLLRQLVSVTERPTRAVAQALQPAFPIALNNLVARLPRNAKLPAQRSHAFSIL